MNMKHKAIEIYQMSVSNEEKIKLLNELMIDCYNEMEAQEENMRPEVHHNLAEGFRLAKNYVRELESGDA